MGRQLKPEDSLSVKVDAGEIATVEDFTYLGSNITRNGAIESEVGVRLGKHPGLRLPTVCCFPEPPDQREDQERSIPYTVLSTLLFEAETWTVKANSVRRLRGFHNYCIRSMLGVIRPQQWRERITSKELAETFGITEHMTEILRKHRLWWIGHVARMDDGRMCVCVRACVRACVCACMCVTK